MKTTGITLSLLCFIAFNMYAAGNEVSNRNRLSEMYDATFNWLLKLSRDRDRDEKILWETSARSRSRLMHILGSHTPESVAFLDHLHQAEALAQVDVPGKFQMTSYPIASYFEDSNEFIQDFSEEPHDELTQIKKFMHDNEIDEYYDYLIALASSTKITDKEKIKKEFVMLPFFKELCNKPKDEREALFEDYYRQLDLTKSYHSLNRLFLAAFCYTGIKLNKTVVPDQFIPSNVLEDALKQDDTPLLEIYLQHGADPNMSAFPFSVPPLLKCHSLHAAQLLLQHGADIYKQHQQYDLITLFCVHIGTSRKDYDDDKLFQLFLSYIPLNKTNKFGKKWITALRKLNYDAFPSYNIFHQRLSALLRRGCHYNHKSQQKIIALVEKDFKLEAFLHEDREEEINKRKQEVTVLFEQDQNRRKNIVFGLRNRALTGKPLATTNLHACYNRALSLDKINAVPMISQVDGPLSFDNLPIGMLPI